MVTEPCKLGRIFLYLLVAHDKTRNAEKKLEWRLGTNSPSDVIDTDDM